MRKLVLLCVGIAFGCATSWLIGGAGPRGSAQGAEAYAREQSSASKDPTPRQQRAASQEATSAAQQQTTAPQYDARGDLLRPRDFATWVFVGSSTGLTYEPGMPLRGAGEFHDVYIRPESYREYARTGKFPEKTVLVLALYPPEENVAPAKAGYFEGELEGMAAAVKDHQHFREGWAYFNFGESGGLRGKATANPKQMCFSCHQQHAADDNVFVQFYPILRPIMQSHKSQPR